MNISDGGIPMSLNVYTHFLCIYPPQGIWHYTVTYRLRRRTMISMSTRDLARIVGAA
jgi:hypothetical protein